MSAMLKEAWQLLAAAAAVWGCWNSFGNACTLQYTNIERPRSTRSIVVVVVEFVSNKVDGHNRLV